MPDKDTSFCTGHRQRLRQKFLDGQLADYELMELLLSYAIPRRDVRPLSRALMSKYKGIPQILAASVADLEKFDGIGENVAVFLKVIYQATLQQYKLMLSSQPIFHDTRTLANFCRMLLSNKTVEEFHVLYLDGMRRLIDSHCHGVGTISWSPVVTRDIVTHALNVGAHSVVILHNHPGCTPRFSNDDIELTKQIIYALNGIDVVVYDHLLITGTAIQSANQNGFVTNNSLTSQILANDKFSIILKELAENP